MLHVKIRFCIFTRRFQKIPPRLAMSKLTTGQRGEAIAQNYLEEQGLVIAERNWRWKRAEIDVIAWDGEALVFVEVKTRTSDQFGRPETFVDRKKEDLLAAAAAAYMASVGHEWEIRFDVIAILLDPFSEAFQLEHFRDAFFPGLH